MLKKSQVLKGEKNFQKIFKKARPLRLSYLKIRSAASLMSGVKIGLIVSAKVSKKAVERNRLKRQLRAIFKDLIDQKKIRDLNVIVTVIKKPDLRQSREVLSRDIGQWLKKACLK
jgi:ribonuclease P protein component